MYSNFGGKLIDTQQHIIAASINNQLDSSIHGRAYYFDTDTNSSVWERPLGFSEAEGSLDAQTIMATMAPLETDLRNGATNVTTVELPVDIIIPNSLTRKFEVKLSHISKFFPSLFSSSGRSILNNEQKTYFVGIDCRNNLYVSTHPDLSNPFVLDAMTIQEIIVRLLITSESPSEKATAKVMFSLSNADD